MSLSVPTIAAAMMIVGVVGFVVLAGIIWRSFFTHDLPSDDEYLSDEEYW